MESPASPIVRCSIKTFAEPTLPKATDARRSYRLRVATCNAPSRSDTGAAFSCAICLKLTGRMICSGNEFRPRNCRNAADHRVIRHMDLPRSRLDHQYGGGKLRARWVPISHGPTLGRCPYKRALAHLCSDIHSCRWDFIAGLPGCNRVRATFQSQASLCG